MRSPSTKSRCIRKSLICRMRSLYRNRAKTWNIGSICEWRASLVASPFRLGYSLYDLDHTIRVE